MSFFEWKQSIFKGTTKFLNGEWTGVELDDEHDNNDDAVAGIR